MRTDDISYFLEQTTVPTLLEMDKLKKEINNRCPTHIYWDENDPSNTFVEIFDISYPVANKMIKELAVSNDVLFTQLPSYWIIEYLYQKGTPSTEFTDFIQSMTPNQIHVMKIKKEKISSSK